MNWRTLAVAGLCATSVPASALTVQLDYSNDQSTDNFFGINTTARSAVEAAAGVIAGLLNTALDEIANDVVVGTSGDTTATFNWSFTYILPSTGGTGVVQTATRAADTVRLYVGVRELQGSDAAQGGPGGAGLGLSGFGFPEEWEGAVANGELQSEAIYHRGGGPVISRITGTSFLDGTPANYSVDHGASIGSFWFDVDSDDDGLTDSPAQLASFWHFDHLTPVPAGKLDFYSVAMHEMLHTLGFGSSVTWNATRQGSNWLGSNLFAENGGSGSNVLDGDGKHLSSSLTSPRLSDGVMQEPLMSPSFSPGQRRGVTEMDYAALRDIGWISSAAVPEPAAIAFLLAGALLLARRDRR